MIIQCETKSKPHKTFCDIFTQAKDISVKFCRFVAHLSTNIYPFEFWSIYLDI